MAMLLLHRPKTSNIIENIAGEETCSRGLGILCLHDETFLSPRTEKGPLLLCASSEYVYDPMKRHFSTLRASAKEEGVNCASCMAFIQIEIQLAAPSFLHSLPQPPFVNKYITARIERRFFGIMRLQTYDCRDNTKQWRVCDE